MVIGLIFGLLFLLFRDDILWFIRSWKYIRQGIANRYYPLKGLMKYTEFCEGENSLDNWLEVYKKKDDPT